MLLVMHTVKAIYPGTFDPLTNGHLDLIARGSKIVDHLVVAILRNTEKGTPLFTVPEREEMIAEATGCWWILLVNRGRRPCCGGFALSAIMSMSFRWR
jgi:cytidyltransferase-like protein